MDQLRGHITNNNNNNNNSSGSGSGSLGGSSGGSLGGGSVGTASEPSLRRSFSNVGLREDYLDDSDGVGKSDVDMRVFLEHLQNASTPHVIIVDASTSQDIAELHPFWLTSGAHVVTANKRAISSSIALYNCVYSAVRNHNRMYMSEVTIGAALPIRCVDEPPSMIYIHAFIYIL